LSRKIIRFLKKMTTSYPLRVQAIRSRGQKVRLYVSFPMALAAAIGLEPGEEVQWELLDRGELHLRRVETPPVLAKAQARKQSPRPS
jgi:hypothetical protein